MQKIAKILFKINIIAIVFFAGATVATRTSIVENWSIYFIVSLIILGIAALYYYLGRRSQVVHEKDE